MKVAIVTGIIGQFGSYMAEFLLEKDYKVIGIHRRSTILNTNNIKKILNHPNFILECADITDSHSINNIVSEYKPDEIYNAAAQSFVKASFTQPYTTFEVDTVGVLNILEAIKHLKPDTKLLQMSTSEMFGSSYSTRVIDSREEKYQDENTVFKPQSPYAIAKLAAHHLCGLYRSAYGIKVACNINYNFESPRRGKEFVTRKITDYVSRVKLELTKEKLYLGNIHAYRDWGHAKDTVRAAWLSLQQENLDDYVIATGKTWTVEQFCDAAFGYVGLNYKDFIEIDSKYFRPAEVDYLKGDASKAKRLLNWEPTISFNDLVAEMVDTDIIGEEV